MPQFPRAVLLHNLRRLRDNDAAGSALLPPAPIEPFLSTFRFRPMHTLPWQTLRDTSRLLTRPVTVLRGIRREHVRPDLLAAVTVALIILPQAMAYSLLAGLPPQTGLYAAMLSGAVGSLWGSSSQLQTGPTNTASLLTLSALTLLSPALIAGTPPYLAAAGLLAVMAGLLRVALGLAGLGMLVRFVSDAVITGFTASAGLLIVANQVRNLLRLNVASTAGLLDTASIVGPKLSETHLPSLLLGLSVIVLIMVLRRVNRRIPGALIAIVLASVVVAVLDLGVKTIGPVPSGLPPLSPLPVTNLELIGQLSTSALSIAAIGLVEAISISRVLASRTGERLNSNQEFVGQGLANIASGLFSGYPVSGSFTRSSVNLQAGAVSPLAGLFSSALLLLATLTLSSLASYIPLAALAGVLMATAFTLVDRKEMARMWRSGGADRLTLVVTLVATLLLPLHFAILAGILMSLGSYLLRTTTPRVRTVVPSDEFRHFEHQPDLPCCPQLNVTEILGDLYFGAVQYVEEQIHRNQVANPGQRFLLLRMHSVHNIDISGIRALESVVRGYRQQGGDLFMVRVRPAVLGEMTSSGFLTTLGRDHLLDEDGAIGHLFYRVLDPAICIYECPVRVFRECQNLPKPFHGDGSTGILVPTTRMTVEPPAIEPRALWLALRDPTPPLVIDVREPREFRQGHVPGSQLIPLPALLADLDQAPRDRRVVLVCRGGRRSARAAAALQAAGHPNVAALRGGMLAWESACLLEAGS
jgi:sulfate permease, SulP family